MKKTILAAALMLTPLLAQADFASALNDYEQRNFPAAYSEFKSLASHNDVDAQFMLGYMYALGEGTVQDYVEAHKWFNLAAAGGKSEARKARDEVAKRMTTRQIAQAQELARTWQPQAAPVVPSPEIQRPFAPSRSTIIEVQRQLAERGYDPGPADGAPGRRTRNAIRAYQRDHQLTIDGQISRELVDSILNQQGDTAESDVRYPEVWEPPAPEIGQQTQELLNELTSLIEKARQRRAADRWLIQDLEALTQQDERTWSELMLEEEFTESDYTWNSDFHVDSGRFDIERGRGLRATAPSKRGDRQLAEQLFESIFNDERNGKRKRQKAAEISYSQEINNAFALRTRIAENRSSRIAINLTQGDNRRLGYRLIMRQGVQGSVDLVRITSSGRSVIDSYNSPLNLDDGNQHTIEWLRETDGSMAVAIDGKELFRTRDQSFKENFDNLSLLNVGGDYLLTELMLFTAGNSQ
jgi:peptidoglycan hydrolase-like protein with peptidoglycan-binding domain